jgi:hypothetical protein
MNQPIPLRCVDASPALTSLPARAHTVARYIEELRDSRADALPHATS